jgi:hypothetical protein
MKNFITFIIPTVARASLGNSLNSLLKQTDSEWCAYVGFDGLTEEQIKTNLIKDDRIKYFYLPKTGFLKNIDFKAQNHSKAGSVRNQLLEKEIDSEWIGFLDDDDTLTPDYVEGLKIESNKNDFDCCIFRMTLKDGTVIPRYGNSSLYIGNVGISFAIKTSFLKQNNIFFESSESEDFAFIKKVFDSKGKIHISDYITYKVNH